MYGTLAVAAQLIGAKGIRLLLTCVGSQHGCPAPERRAKARPDQSPLDRPYCYLSHDCPAFTSSNPSAADVLLKFPQELEAFNSVVCVAIPASEGRVLAVQVDIEGFLSLLPEERRLCIRALSYVLNLGAAYYLRGGRPEGSDVADEHVHDLLQAALQAREAEMEAMGMELHDGAIQSLTAAFQYLQTAEALVPEGHPSMPFLLRSRELLRQGMKESRELANSLRPKTLSLGTRPLDLVALLREELVQLERDIGCKWEIDSGVTNLPEGLEGPLYKIVHEALINVRRHSNAPAVKLTINQEGGQVLARVQDWGKGFEPTLVAAQRQKVSGLTSMRRRAEALGGGCQIESSPGNGTLVSVWVPIQP